ncbi:MAG: PAS domain S-box protein [Candidatus Marinimicrobia bacterium]|nr:PAS domain S-box protein [Candidatus Neomarinimicrobiota bacterium]
MIKNFKPFRIIISVVILFTISIYAEPLIRVGLYENSPKIFTDEKDKPAGFFIDIIDAIAREENWRLDYVSGTWQECIENLEKGELDLLPDVAFSAEREKIFDFNRETVLINWAQLYLTEASTIATLFDLEAKQVAVLRGDYSYTEFRRDLADFKIQCDFIECDSFREIFQLLANGAADAGLISRLYGIRFEKDYPVIKSPIVCCPADLRFAAPKGQSGQYLQAIDRHIIALKNDPRSYYYVALDKRLGIVVETERGPDWYWIGGMIGLGLVACVIIIILVKIIHTNLEIVRVNYRDLYENAPVAYFSIGRDGRIQHCNRAAAKLIGFGSPGMLKGLPIIDFYANTGFGKERAKQNFQRFLKGEAIVDELQMQRKDGTIFWVKEIVNAVRDKHGWIGESRLTVIDISEQKYAESALIASEERFRLAFDNIPDVVVIYDKELRIQYINAATTRITGRLPADFIGKRDDEVWPPEVYDSYLPSLKKAFETGTLQTVQIELSLAEGGVCNLRITCIPVLDNDGAVREVLGITHDFTGQKQAEEAIHLKAQNLAIILEVSKTLVSSLDLKTVLQATTDGLVELTGLDSAAIYLYEKEFLYLRATTPPLPSGFPDNYRRVILKDHPHIQKTMASGKPIIVPDIKNTNLTPEEAQIAAVRDLRSIIYLPIKLHEKVSGTIIVASCHEPRPIKTEVINLCITLANLAAIAIEKGQYYQQIKQYTTKLEELVSRRTVQIEKEKIALEQANQKLQELDQLKSIFLASMSHELRTPLNSIIGFTGIMLMELSGKLNDEQKKQMKMVKSSSAHLLSLINDILDISKIEAGKTEIEVETFSLSQTITDVTDGIWNAAIEKNLTLQIRPVPDILITTDKRRFKQILVNLLSNAVKYTDAGTIKVSVSLYRKTLAVSVKDSGIGINSNDLSRLFQPFQQIDASLTKSQEGTGLGLYLCEKIAALLGGRIRVKSKSGQGSTFTVTIPKQLKSSKT